MSTQGYTEDRKDLLALLPYEEQGIIRKQILKGEKGNAVVYSIYEGEKLVCESFSSRVLLIGLEGEAHLTLGDENFNIGPLVSMTIPEGAEYSLVANTNFKLLLVSRI